MLINAAEILCKDNERYRFVIVGDGAQRKELHDQTIRLGLKEKVIFTGLCKNTAEVMIAFDMAVVPSRREAFGIAAVELMQMRIPVIASAVGGLVELLHRPPAGDARIDQLRPAREADGAVRQNRAHGDLEVRLGVGHLDFERAGLARALLRIQAPTFSAPTTRLISFPLGL